MKLSVVRIAESLAEAEGWQLEDVNWIVKKYRFRKFMDGIAFVARVSDAAERLNHHPFIAIDYKMITLRLTSWDAGGLTELDFIAAAEFDRAFLPLRP